VEPREVFRNKDRTIHKTDYAKKSVLEEDKDTIEIEWNIENRLFLKESPRLAEGLPVTVSVAVNAPNSAHGDVLMALLVDNGKEQNQTTWIFQTKQRDSVVPAGDWEDNWFRCHKGLQPTTLGNTQWVVWGRDVVWPRTGEKERKAAWVGCAEEIVSLEPYLKLRDKWLKATDKDVSRSFWDVSVEKEGDFGKRPLSSEKVKESSESTEH